MDKYIIELTEDEKDDICRVLGYLMGTQEHNDIDCSSYIATMESILEKVRKAREQQK
jgi:hypothetical protein